MATIDPFISNWPQLLIGLLLLLAIAAFATWLTGFLGRRLLPQRHDNPEAVQGFLKASRLFVGMITFGLAFIVYGIYSWSVISSIIRGARASGFIGPAAFGVILIYLGIHCLRREYRNHLTQENNAA